MNIKKDLVSIALAVILVFLLSMIAGIIINKQLEGPGLCSSCHEMLPYYNSTISPLNGSIISKHSLTCIQCHANNSLNQARKNILIEIIVYNLNISGRAFPPGELTPECRKCHYPESPVHTYLKNETCTDCHWAHSQNINSQNASLNVTNISLISRNASGPHMAKKCQECHGMNFEIPRCIKCHSGHGDQKLENDQCLSCHSDPHIPKIPGIFKNNTVIFKEKLPFSVCKPCHINQYSNITNFPTGHNDMGTCTLCHEWHGEKPKCKKCHPFMMIPRHPKSFDCDTCHIAYRPILVKCQDCHGSTHEWSAATAIINPK